jgi:hypothetical protein
MRRHVTALVHGFYAVQHFHSGQDTPRIFYARGWIEHHHKTTYAVAHGRSPVKNRAVMRRVP